MEKSWQRTYRLLYFPQNDRPWYFNINQSYPFVLCHPSYLGGLYVEAH